MNRSTKVEYNGHTCYDQAVVTPNQSVQKRRLREWENNNTMPSSFSSNMPSMTPDASSPSNLTHIHALSFVTQASDSEMDDMDDESHLNCQILADRHHETKRIRTDVETIFSSESSYKEYPSQTQKSSNQSNEWWRKKSRMEEEVTVSPSNGTRNDRNIHGASGSECHICQTNTVQTPIPSIFQSHSFSSIHSPKKTKQKNSLLSYFNPTKSALSKTFSNKSSENSQRNHKMCSPRLPSPPTCSYCDRISCDNCCKICEQCQSNFCTFCHTVNYESNVEKIMCFNCYESVTVSSNCDMDLS